jgi:sugar lactone lactonase YvrE
MKAEVVLACESRLGEGPVWDQDHQVLYWVDITGSLVNAYWPASGEHRSWPVPHHVGCLAVRETGGLVLALRDGFATLDLATGAVAMIAAVEADKPANRFNDGRCSREGRFFAGSLAYTEDHPAGTLWRLDPDHTATPVMGGITVNNGLCFSPDGRTMYHVDTPTREIRAYDYDPATGLPGNGRTFARVADGAGYPDGSVVDSEGFLWNGEWDGARAVRYAPDGTVDRVVDVPARRVTCCALGGPDLKTLYLTTAYDRMSPAERAEWPLSGHLFALPVDVAGLPDPKFKG